MEEIKKEKQLKIELRNNIAYRLVESKANLIYWKKVVRQSKSNTPEIMEAIKKAAFNEQNIQKDILFLKCIDEMLKGKS